MEIENRNFFKKKFKKKMDRAYGMIAEGENT